MKRVKAIRLTKQNWGPESLRDSKTKKMCCLGVFGAACGVDLEEMIGLGMPHEVDASERGAFPKWLFADGASSRTAQLLASANDHYFQDTNKASRKVDKHVIRKNFAQHGVRVTFARGL